MFMGLGRWLVAVAIWLSAEYARIFAALGIMGADSLAISVWRLKHDPALLAERLSPVVQRRQMDLREHTSGSDTRGEPHL
jgi:hypothetical protein